MPNSVGDWLLHVAVGTALVTLAAAAAEARQQEEQPRQQEEQAHQQEEQAQQEEPTAEARGWSIGGRGIFATASEESLEQTFGLSGFAIYPIAADVEFEAEAGLIRPSTAIDGLADGRLTLLPIRGTIRFRLWRFGNVVPYAGGGAGVYLADFSVASSVEDRLDRLGFTVAQDIESSVGVHAGGGIEWETGSWVFGLDAKWVVASADASSRVIDQVTGLVFTDSSDVELDGLWLSFGISVRL